MDWEKISIEKHTLQKTHVQNIQKTPKNQWKDGKSHGKMSKKWIGTTQ